MRGLLRVFGILTLLSLAAGVSPAAERDLLKDLEYLERLREQVEVDAEHVEYDAARRRVVARGGVRFSLGQVSVAADEVTADLDGQVLTAAGNVVLSDGSNRLEGEEVEYNLQTGLGVVRRGRGVLFPGLGVRGAEIRREGEREFRLLDGAFTSCRACQPEPITPDWEFRAAETTVHLDDYAIADHASVWIKGLPAFYFPRVVVPVSQRRTGFLIPRAGVGGRDGVMLALPFFWAISPSQDLTVTPTYRTKRGPEFFGEYRYVLAEDARGWVTGRYLYDTELEEGRSRSEFRWRHDQALSPSLMFKADVNYLSDDALARDFIDSSVASRTQRALTSNVSLTQTTSQYVVLGRIGAEQDLSSSDASRSAQLPEGRLQWLPAAYAGGRLVGEGIASAGYLEQNRTVDVGRFDLYPLLHLPIDLVPGVTAVSSVGLRETAYTDSALADGRRNRIVVEARERLGTRLMRRFGLPQGPLRSLTHVVEPSVTYQYRPWVDQRPFPQFDIVDFVSPQNRLTLRLGNRLMGRGREVEGGAGMFDLASLTIEQSVNLQPQVREFSDIYLAGLTPERVDQAVENVRSLGNGFSQAEERVWSNTVVRGYVNPVPGLGLRGAIAINPEGPRADGISGGLEYRWSDRLWMEIGHAYVRGRQANGLVARLGLQATRAILLDFSTRYDGVSGSFLEHGAGLKYTSCCWEVSFRYTHRAELPTRTAENDFKVSFDLKIPTASGLGSATKPAPAAR
jgi:LPS-assembly protein